MSKKTRENLEFDFTQVYPVSNSQILQIPKEKKLFQTDDFSQQNQKNSKIPKKTQKCITKKIVNFSRIFYFLDFFIFLDFFRFF